MVVNIDETDIYSKPFLEKLKNFIGLDSNLVVSESLYENKSVNYSSRYLKMARKFAVRIRMLSPRFFDSPFMRRCFYGFMAIAAKVADKEDVEIDVSKEEYMSLFNSYEESV